MVRIFIGGKNSGEFLARFQVEVLDKIDSNLRNNISLFYPAGNSFALGFDRDRELLSFSRECFMIKNSDLIVVELYKNTILENYPIIGIAKKYKKRIVGFCKEINCQFEGDFFCDRVVRSFEELALYVTNVGTSSLEQFDFINFIDEAVKYYEEEYLCLDDYVKSRC